MAYLVFKHLLTVSLLIYTNYVFHRKSKMHPDDCQTDHRYGPPLFFAVASCKTQAINEPLSWLLAGVHVPATVGKAFLFEIGKTKGVK